MKLRNLLAVSATAFTLLSCNDSDNHPTPGKGELTPITVNIKGNADTRALTGEETGATNENDINSLEFFVFNSDGSFQKYYKPVSVASDNQYTFLVNAGSLTILTAANQNLGEPSPAPVSLADFKKSSSYKELSLDGTNSRSDISTSLGFAMAAEGTANVVEGETNKLNLSIRRLLSKVESPKVAPTNEIKIPDTELLKILGLGTSEAVPNDLKWTFKGYMVINGINQSLAFEYENLTNWERFATASNFLPAGYDKPVYVYENIPTMLQGGNGQAATVFDKDEVVAFIIKGTFSGTRVSDATRYWRVNLLKDDAWKIFRNSIYRITMQDITTVGWGTPKEAEEEGPVIDPSESSITIDIEVAKWDVRTQDVDL